MISKLGSKTSFSHNCFDKQSNLYDVPFVAKYLFREFARFSGETSHFRDIELFCFRQVMLPLKKCAIPTNTISGDWSVLFSGDWNVIFGKLRHFNSRNIEMCHFWETEMGHFLEIWMCHLQYFNFREIEMCHFREIEISHIRQNEMCHFRKIKIL